jgi:branched-chain amino acid transport system permease protein
MSWTTVGQAILAGLANGAFYAFLALSFTVIFALTRALNLAHGELVLLGGYLGYAAARAFGLPTVLLVPLAAIALVPLGLLWHLLLSRVREPVELNSLVLTFGLSLVLQQGMLSAWSADYRLIPGDAVEPLALGLSRGRAAAAVLALVAIAGLQLLLSRTRLGAALRATSGDAETAALLGVNIDRVAVASFAVAAAIAGAGGVLFGLVHYLHPAAGVELTLLAITLAIFGRTLGTAGSRVGPLGGLLLGGLLLGLAESLTVTWAGPRWRELVAAALLLGALLAWPQGRPAERFR